MLFHFSIVIIHEIQKGVGDSRDWEGTVPFTIRLHGFLVGLHKNEIPAWRDRASRLLGALTVMSRPVQRALS